MARAIWMARWLEKIQIRIRCASQPADQQLALIDHLRREVVMKQEEQLLVIHYLAAPGCPVDCLELVKKPTQLLAGDADALPVDVLKVRSPADWSLFALRAAANAVNDPLQHTHVLRVARP